MNGVVVGGGHLGHKGFDVELEPPRQLLGMSVSRGAIVAMLRPEHRDVRLGLRGKMEDDGFVRTIIRRDNGPAPGLRDGPLDNFGRGRVAQIDVGV